MKYLEKEELAWLLGELTNKPDVCGCTKVIDESGFDIPLRHLFKAYICERYKRSEIGRKFIFGKDVLKSDKQFQYLTQTLSKMNFSNIDDTANLINTFICIVNAGFDYYSVRYQIYNLINRDIRVSEDDLRVCIELKKLPEEIQSKYICPSCKNLVPFDDFFSYEFICTKCYKDRKNAEMSLVDRAIRKLRGEWM